VSRVSLLDVNVLVALFDPDHVHHELAHDWFTEQRRHGWSTCPITENGLIRVLSNPAYSPVAERPGQVLKRLATFCRSGHHVFWPDLVSLRDPKIVRAPLAATHRQTTDLYLLALAVRRDGCLATFDRHVPQSAVAGARVEHIVVIGP